MTTYTATKAGVEALAHCLSMELEGTGIRSHTLRGHLPMLDVARPEQNREAVRREIFRDLQTDSFIGPGDQGDWFVLHGDLLCLRNGLSTPPGRDNLA